MNDNQKAEKGSYQYSYPHRIVSLEALSEQPKSKTTHFTGHQTQRVVFIEKSQEDRQVKNFRACEKLKNILGRFECPRIRLATESGGADRFIYRCNTNKCTFRIEFTVVGDVQSHDLSSLSFDDNLEPMLFLVTYNQNFHFDPDLEKFDEATSMLTRGNETIHFEDRFNLKIKHQNGEIS